VQRFGLSGAFLLIAILTIADAPPIWLFTFGGLLVALSIRMPPNHATMTLLVMLTSLAGMLLHRPEFRTPFAGVTGLVAVTVVALAVQTRLARDRDVDRLRLTARDVHAVLWEELDGPSWSLDVSPSAERILGYPVAEWRRPHFATSRVHPDDLPALRAANAADDGRPALIRVLHDNGTWLWMENRTTWIHDRTGKRLRRVGVLIDRTAQHDAEQRAHAFGQLAASSPVAQLLITREPDGARLSALNHQAGDLLGIDPSMVGQPLERLTTPAATIPSLLHSVLQDPSRMSGMEFHGPDERVYQTTVQSLGDETVSIAFLDVTERVKASQRLETQARQDHLTGLPNRRAFVDELERRLGNSSSGPISVLLIDLDEFKEVNDSLGHETGDQLLRAVGRRVAGRCRTTDLVARLGGDEFAVILDGMPGDAAHDRAATIGESIMAPAVIGGIRLRVGASIGVACYPSDANSASELVRCADVAMYHAKRRGSGVERYAASIDDFGEDRLQLIADFERAIEMGDLTVVHQPLIDVGSGAVRASEVLARWRHPTRGPIPPTTFVEIAEITGNMKLLTRHILRQAVQDQRHMARCGHDIDVTVNVSIRNLYEPNLVEWLGSLLEQAGVQPQRVILEITENTIMEDQGAALETVEALSRLGIRTWIDDFGTGHSSFARLRALPVDGVKIDRAFVSPQAQEPTDRILLKNMIELVQSLGLTTVAEGVETAEAATLLKTMGCDIAQGYYYTAPLERDELIAYVQRVTALGAADRSDAPTGDSLKSG